MRDEHGNVCPSDWKNGGKTTRGDPIAKLDHFTIIDGEHENGKANGTKRARVE
jgi:hypothetical protein